ncbi:helix-turn-helix domain-containing protein [Anaerotalea alkaliphila]|uniref:Helix-turn-helix domain-containing protein n=1 Tax=Anaerotalea alkaliphila TaxID=2662126 RepID=A0A7X5KMU9_9FIRM|nr:helix-turn-helix domain-containing protein [Anaerotalea alkaliphila]NDL68341.1 helix-turn-helix domain-containing protein [Anaerotalea alkaliphila]
MDGCKFDLNKALYVLESFSNSVDVPCRLIDEKGEVIRENGSISDPSKKMGLDEQLIRDSLLYGAHQASIYGGSYIFFGPYACVYFTTPIMVEMRIGGSIVCGPLLMQPADNFLIDKILEATSSPDLTRDRIEELAAEIKIIPPPRVKALADLLFAGMHYIGGDGYEKFLMDRTGRDSYTDPKIYMEYLQTMGGTVEGGVPYPLEKEKELLKRIAIGDRLGANRVVNEIISMMYIQSGMGFRQLKSRVLELVVLLSRAAMDGGAQVEEVLGMNYSYLNEIQDFSDAEQLTQWLGRICHKFSESVFNFGKAKHKDAIYKAMDHIKQYYMNKLTLEEVAAYVHFSTAYFSKIFSDEVGMSFSKYLNRIRITNSQLLLKSTDMNIAEVAGATGFHDQSHFTKMFKTVTGMSPKQYRDSR